MKTDNADPLMVIAASLISRIGADSSVAAVCSVLCIIKGVSTVTWKGQALAVSHSGVSKEDPLMMHT